MEFQASMAKEVGIVSTNSPASKPQLKKAKQISENGLSGFPLSRLKELGWDVAK